MNEWYFLAIRVCNNSVANILKDFESARIKCDNLGEGRKVKGEKGTRRKGKDFSTRFTFSVESFLSQFSFRFALLNRKS